MDYSDRLREFVINRFVRKPTIESVLNNSDVIFSLGMNRAGSEFR